MITKKVLIFGASGQIGRYCIRRLVRNNYKVIAVTRNTHQKGYILKTQAPIGYLDIEQTSILDEERINQLLSNADVCVNLVGILHETGKNNTFNKIHTEFPDRISKICKKKNVDLIHVSALALEKAKNSKYAQSKINGEIKIRENFDRATIIKPSIVFSVDDKLSTKFMSLLSLLPIFPLYYNGKTKFSPMHVSEICEVIKSVIDKNICSDIIECVGPEELSFREILQKLLISINKKRLLIPLPIQIAKFIAFFFEKFPKPLITRDQLKILKYDNVLTGQYKSNIDIGIVPKLKFDQEILKYSYMWKEGGQYSK